MDSEQEDSGPSVTELVQAAVAGDQQAWDALVARYSPLLMSVLRKYRLGNDDIHDIAQTVWLRMIENLGNLREPRALPSWIITTARNESLRVLKAGARTRPFSSMFDGEAPMPDKGEAVDDDLLLAERREALLEAFAELSDRERELLTLLVADPAVPYVEIGRRLGMAVGSIGPTRARILGKLRVHQAIAAFA
ncbi:MAG: sigma-70 family RNA polymerase sigma factor [Propionibacteriaceae bacterium]